MITKQTFDLRSLALLRILLGLYLLYDVYSRLKHGRLDLLWYTSDGWQEPHDSPHKSPIHQIWFYRGSELFQGLAFGIVVILAVLFTLGFHCNALSKSLLWVAVVAMQHRNMHSHDGSDTYTRHVLLWCCQLPVEQVWSITPHITTQKTTESAATLGLALQIVFMYLGTCLNRTTDIYSLSELTKSEWLPPQLSAVYFALSGSFASRDIWLGDVVRQTPLLNQFMTLSAMLGEGLAPILCFLLPFSYQDYPAIILWSLHFGLLLLMNLPNWQFVGMLTTVVWISSRTWDQLERITWLVQSLKIHDTRKKTDNASLAPKRQQTRPYWTYFFIAYMTYNWLGERGIIRKHDSGDIGEFLRFSQHWVMYSIPPKTAVQTILVGKLTGNDEYVDVWKWIQTKDSTTIVDLEQRQSKIWTNMTHIYPSPRWERALDGWGQRKDIQRATYFLEKMCHEGEWTELKLVWQDLQIGGPKKRFEKRGPNIPINVKC